MAKANELKKLEAEYVTLSGQVEQKALELAKLRARLAELPPLLAKAEGKEEAALAKEYGELHARELVTGAVLRELRHQQTTTLVRSFALRESEAQAEIERAGKSGRGAIRGPGDPGVSPAKGGWRTH